MSTKKDSTFVRNITRSYQHISDMKLTISPLAVLDLSTLDADVVKRSQDLRNAIDMGHLRKISAEDAQEVSKRNIAKLRQSVTRRQEERELQTARAEGKEFEVDAINLSRADTAKLSDEISSAGYANDPLSYALALEVAQEQAELQGKTLSIEEFAERVDKNPDIVSHYLRSSTNFNPIADDGYDPVRNRKVTATTLEPSKDGRTSKVVQKRLDQQSTREDFMDMLESGVAEEINLTDED